MSAQHQVATLLPYWDVNKREVHYAPLRLQGHSPAAADSDEEPLISGPTPTELDEDSLMRFTATGRPMPLVTHSPAVNMYSVPSLLPKRYTDDSIIPAIIINVIPSPSAPAKKPKGGLRRILTGGKEEGAGEDGITKVVFMPRREYLKHFARGQRGEFIGTAEERRWSEEELEELYGRFRPVVPKRRFF